MAGEIGQWFSSSNVAALVTAVAPIATGVILDRLKPFLPESEDISKRTRYLESILTDRLSDSCEQLFKNAIELPAASPNLPAIYSDHVDLLVHSQIDLSRLHHLRASTNKYFSGLFWSCILSLGCLVLPFVSWAKVFLLPAAIAIILTQFGFAILIKRAEGITKAYEEDLLRKKKSKDGS